MTPKTYEPHDLSFVADALLALCEGSASHPFYTEPGFHLKLRLADRREPFYDHLVRQRGDDPLLRQECHDVFQMARLTERQSTVLMRRLEGWTFEEIGKSCFHSKQGAQNIFVQALKKIARAFRVYAYTGLSDVYRSETRRGLPRTGLGRIPQSAH